MNPKIKKRYIQEKGRISIRQLLFLIITVVVATADVLLPNFVVVESKQDSWIAVIIGTIGAMLIMNIYVSLALKYYKKTIIEYATELMGRFVGKIIGIMYCFYFLHFTWLVTRKLADIYVVSFNPQIPMIAISITAIIVAAYAVFSGLEVIARVNEIALPAGLFILTFIVLVNINNMEFDRFLPVLQNGFIPPLRGGFLVYTWILQSIFILQIIPFVKDKEKLRKIANIGVVILGGSLGIGVLAIAIFGVNYLEEVLYPALEMVRLVTLGRSIQNLDITIMMVWIIGIFIKITVFYYCTVLSAAQILNLKSYKYIILPFGLLISSFSIISMEGVPQFINFMHYIYPIYSILPITLVPIGLYIKSLFVR